MPATIDFETQLRGPWETASGFLVEQLELLQAQLAPIFPLITGIQTTANAAAGNAIVGITGYPVSSILITDSAATPSFSATLPCPLGFMSVTVVSPTALAANTNDYAPATIQAAAVLRISSTGAVDLTGIVAASTAHAKLLINVGTFTITLKHASGSSSAANRFRCPGAADYSLTQSNTVWIWYDATSTVWQVVS